MSLPSKAEAEQFALMIVGGMPHYDAIGYFYPDLAEEEKKSTIRQWLRNGNVREAVLAQQGGKAWQGMTLSERIEFAINKHYSEMAYFLYSHNYSTLAPQEKAKADTCRASLEAKLAGTSGRLNPLEQWWDDMRRGKVVGVATATQPKLN